MYRFIGLCDNFYKTKKLQKLEWVSAWQQIWKIAHKVEHVPDKKLEWKEGESI